MIVIIILKISLKANISVNNHLMFDFHTFYVFDLCLSTAEAVMNTFVGEPIFKIRDRRPWKKLKGLEHSMLPKSYHNYGFEYIFHRVLCL